MPMTTMHAEPCIRIRCPHGYVSDEQKKLLKPIVASKLGLSELQEHWNQVGRQAIGTFTVKARPPTTVGLADITAAIDKCPEYDFVLGLAADGRPVTISLDDDSPHIACSAGSGAGKSVLAMVLGIQVLRKGGRVLVIDRKGSHRWARGLPGVTYCSKVADMHAALIGTASLADTRNNQAMEEPEGWDPGERVFVIFEEMNATVAQLKAYWERDADKLWDPGNGKPPKLSPAIQAFREIMYMGRSAKVNLFGVAQMLTATTTGGPEARENFGVRCLARYTANNWKMLAPQCAMPRRSKVRGRWQIVIGDDVIETQVAFAIASEARDFAQREADITSRTDPPGVGPSPDPVFGSSGVAGAAGDDAKPNTRPNSAGPVRYTLAEAARSDWCPLAYDALRMARSRSDHWPTPHMRGSRETWTEDELRAALGDRIPAR